MARASERARETRAADRGFSNSSRLVPLYRPLVVSRLCLRRLSPSVETRCPRVDVAEGGINWRERSSVALMISPRSRRRRSSLGKPTLRISTYVRTRIIYTTLTLHYRRESMYVRVCTASIHIRVRNELG